MKLDYSLQIFEKYANIKFQENPLSGSRGVPYGRTDGRAVRQTDKTMLIVAFSNFTKATKNCYIILALVVTILIS